MNLGLRVREWVLCGSLMPGIETISAFHLQLFRFPSFVFGASGRFDGGQVVQHVRFQPQQSGDELVMLSLDLRHWHL